MEQRTGLLGDRRQRRNILDHADLVVHRHDADQQRRNLQRFSQHIGVQQPVSARTGRNTKLEPLTCQGRPPPPGDTVCSVATVITTRRRSLAAWLRSERLLIADVVALGSRHDVNTSAPWGLRRSARQRAIVHILDHAASASVPITCSAAVGVAVVLGEPRQHTALTTRGSQRSGRPGCRDTLGGSGEGAVRAMFMAINVGLEAARDTSASRSRAAIRLDRRSANALYIILCGIPGQRHRISLARGAPSPIAASTWLAVTLPELAAAPR